MSDAVLGAFFTLMLLFFVLFSSSLEYITIADSDNETSTVNANRNTMTVAVNWGNARVNEAITINEEIAVEATVRNYADSSDFFASDRYVNIKQVNSNPANLAVDVFSKVNTPFMNMSNSYMKEQNDSNTNIRSREIVIWEAKKIEK